MSTQLTPEKIEEIKQAARVSRALMDTTATDKGTCVLGAGVVLYTFAPFNRIMLISQPFHGNVGSYQALMPCLLHLKGQFPDFDIEWYDGQMD